MHHLFYHLNNKINLNYIKFLLLKIFLNQLNNDLLYLSRSPIPKSKKGEEVEYKRHLGLYGLSRDALLFYAKTPRGYLESIEDVEMLRFMENGYRIKILEVKSESIGVDNPEDIEKVEAAIRNGQ